HTHTHTPASGSTLSPCLSAVSLSLSLSSLSPHSLPLSSPVRRVCLGKRHLSCVWDRRHILISCPCCVGNACLIYRGPSRSNWKNHSIEALAQTGYVWHLINTHVSLYLSLPLSLPPSISLPLSLYLSL